ncbi:hypothetical protein VTI74DRAFT_3826 [Chaetomium olivicolor]
MLVTAVAVAALGSNDHDVVQPGSSRFYIARIGKGELAREPSKHNRHWGGRIDEGAATRKSSGPFPDFNSQSITGAGATGIPGQPGKHAALADCEGTAGGLAGGSHQTVPSGTPLDPKVGEEKVLVRSSPRGRPSRVVGEMRQGCNAWRSPLF